MIKKLRAVLLVLLVSLIGFGGLNVYHTVAYLTDNDFANPNKFTFANVDITLNEDFDAPTVAAGTNSYTKKVWFTNDGTTSAFARANMQLSNDDVANVTEVSGDGGKTWYSWNDYKNHLPSGWVYESGGTLGGYYYYTKGLAVGASTSALITNVRTTFKSNDVNRKTQDINKTARGYDIYVYVEGLQQKSLDASKTHTSYSDAWTAFLNKKG